MSSSHALKMRLAPWALLLVSAAWGLAFVVMKDAIEKQSVNSFLFSRFLVAVIAMVLLKPSVLKTINREILKKGFIAGLFLASGYILQTFGLALTGAAIAGFITGLYVVATPVLAAVLLKVRITPFTWSCVALATLGLALLSLKGWNLGLGEFLVFLCAIAFAAHIIALSKWSNGLDVYAMTIVQLATCALLTGAISFAQGYEAPVDLSGWLVVLYTAVVCTAVAFVVQTWSQAHMSATKVAVILTMEVVFAAVFAVIFGGESISLRALLGGVLVVAAMFMIVLKEA
ncbi:MAG: DMT family transporter [Actinobacteria bacterium]|nr:DMT family transporter [Actinomycetota bacterium]